jgi:hypothetical protein
MGRLKDLYGYLEDRIQVMAGVEKRLCELQTKYEAYFAEVTRVRESELAQLTAHILADRSKLPSWLTRSIDRAKADVEAEFEERLLAVRKQIAAQRQEAEAALELSRGAEAEVRKKNVALDQREEQLKARNAKLLADISEFNARIRTLGKGFGFFSNLFRMRELASKRVELDREQADVAAHVEAVRKRWTEEESQHAEQETGLRKEWIDARGKVTALEAKLEYLEGARSSLIVRSTLERVLFELRKEPPASADTDPRCRRCNSPNPDSAFFCRICALRLKPDRPDLEGSVEEIAEVNLHHKRFAEGMQAGQQLIGLVRGIKSGLVAFRQSVQSVIDSEKRYPLPKLQIDIPQSSLTYGQHFDALQTYVQQDLSLHPKEFATQVQPLVRDVLTEAHIKGYFEAMGEELSRQAGAQWH